MSRHAILITAYKNVESVTELIETLGTQFNFYVHFDRKNNFDLDVLDRFKNVKYWREYNVKWGGVNHLSAIIMLAECALRDKENTFFHLITAEDFPIKSSERILAVDITKSYIKSKPFPFYGWDSSGGHDRYRRYQLYDIFNAKTKLGARLINLILLAQKKLGIVRGSIFNCDMFGGSTYWSLNREVLEYVMQKIDVHLKKRLKLTFCAEEFVFQTIIENSNYRNSIVNDNLRYIDWSSKRGGDPAFLDESDFEVLLESNALFARKIIKNEDNKLLQMLKKVI